MSYEAVVSGDDGVLTEPTPSEVLRRAVRDAFAEFDAEPTTEGVDGVVHGGLTRIKRVCEVHDVDPEAFWPRREARAADAQRVGMESGTKPLYDDADAVGELDVPLGVVSSSQHATVEHVLDVYDLREHFAVAYGREPRVDALRRCKPSPHYLERALSDLAVESALYVGDSNVGVLAASRAGIDSAYVRRPHRADYRLAADPTYEIDSLRDLSAIC